VLTYTRVNITCQASGIPTPKITWLRKGVPVKSYDNSSLVLSISDRDDAGQVTCIAENLAGNATQGTKIDVIGKEIHNTNTMILNIEPFLRCIPRTICNLVGFGKCIIGTHVVISVQHKKSPLYV